MDFTDLALKIKYTSFNDDIINEFYHPVLSQSMIYQRAVGYFSSSVLISYLKGLKGLIDNGGHVELLISPYMSENDIETFLNEGYIDLTTNLNELFESMLNGDVRSKSASQLFYLLVKLKKIIVRIATPRNIKGLFHEKIGLFYDENQHVIAINGSNNETSAALNFNIESFNVFCSWKEGHQVFVDSHVEDFKHLWRGDNQNVIIYALEQALSQHVIEKLDTQNTEDELWWGVLKEDTVNYQSKQYHIKPYDYQLEAVNQWFEKKQGIFKFATGTGKTKTSIYLMEKLEDEELPMFFIIVVPDKTLVNQWFDELQQYEKNVIKCFSDNTKWHNELKDAIDIYQYQPDTFQYVVVTNQTFFSNRFDHLINKLNNEYLLVVDECHTWGTKRILSHLPNPKMRLGLSATPELFFSENKTEQLFDFFSGIIYEYSLEKAIKNKKLVQYEYYPIVVGLEEDEKELYREYTRKIVKLIGHDIDEYNERYAKYQSILETYLFNRARIIYGAKQKLSVLKEIVKPISDKGNLLIYCGPTSFYLEDESNQIALNQLQAVNYELGQLGIKFAQYTSKENERERRDAIETFKNRTYSTLVAIKCLDQGVDIPQIERAIILASSTNPREFIQRRGRILRTYPNKEKAEIYDFIVLDDEFEYLNKKEIKRLMEFSKLSLNHKENMNQFSHLINQYTESREKDDELR